MDPSKLAGSRVVSDLFVRYAAAFSSPVSRGTNGLVRLGGLHRSGAFHGQGQETKHRGRLGDADCVYESFGSVDVAEENLCFYFIFSILSFYFNSDKLA